MTSSRENRRQTGPDATRTGDETQAAARAAPQRSERGRRILVATANPGKLREIKAVLASALRVTSCESGVQIARPLADSGCLEFLSLADLPAPPSEPEETGETFAANARLKAAYYSTRTGLWTLADDSGLEVDALGGEPGVRSARYAAEKSESPQGGRAGLWHPLLTGVTSGTANPRVALDAANNRKLIARLAGVPAERRTARFRCALALADGERILAETEGVIEGRIVDEPRGTGGFGYDPHFHVGSLGRTTAELSAEEKNRVSHRGQALRRMAQAMQEFLAGQVEFA